MFPIRKVEKIIAQLCQTAGMPPQPSSAKQNVHQLLLASLFLSHQGNLAYCTPACSYDLETKTECLLSYHSVVYRSLPPAPCAYLVYNEIVEIGQPVLSIVSAIPQAEMPPQLAVHE